MVYDSQVFCHEFSKQLSRWVDTWPISFLRSVAREDQSPSIRKAKNCWFFPRSPVERWGRFEGSWANNFSHSLFLAILTVQNMQEIIESQLTGEWAVTLFP